jgi:hypothetical protein
MKRLLIFLVIFLPFIRGEAQTTTTSDRVVTKSLYLRDWWVDSVKRDTNFLGGNRSIPTAAAVYNFVAGRGAPGYTSVTSLPDSSGLIFHGPNGVKDTVVFEGETGSGGVTQAALNDSTSVLRDSINALRADIASGGGGASLYYNITAYGASTASADNTTAIQAAIDAANVSGGTVYIPSGTFKTNTLQVYGNVRITGDGQRASILQAASAVPILQSVGNADNTLQSNGGLTIENLQLDGNSVGTIGMNYENIAHFKFDNLYIRRFAQIGIKGRGLLVGAFSNSEIELCPIGVDLDKSSTVLPNLIEFNSVQIHFAATWGIKYVNGSGLILNATDMSACGTKDNVNTGGLYVKGDAGLVFTWNGGWTEVCSGTIVYIDAPIALASKAQPIPSLYKIDGVQFSYNNAYTVGENSWGATGASQTIYFDANEAGEKLVITASGIAATNPPINMNGTQGKILLVGATIGTSLNTTAYGRTYDVEALFDGATGGGTTFTNYTQNFDAVTAPALPATMEASSGVVTVASANAYSAGNALQFPQDGAAKSAYMSAAPESANYTLKAKFRTGASGIATQFYLMGRSTAKVFDPGAGGSQVGVRMVMGTTNLVELYYRSAAPAYNGIASVVPASIPLNEWYEMTLTISGSSLAVKIKRLSDNTWMNLAGEFVVLEQAALTGTTTVSGAGYAGIGFYGDSGAAQNLTDDFSITY